MSKKIYDFDDKIPFGKHKDLTFRELMNKSDPNYMDKYVYKYKSLVLTNDLYAKIDDNLRRTFFPEEND